MGCSCFCHREGFAGDSSNHQCCNLETVDTLKAELAELKRKFNIGSSTYVTVEARDHWRTLAEKLQKELDTLKK